SQYAYAVNSSPPLFCDFNVYHLIGTARLAFTSLTGSTNLAQWQALGFDVNGLLADPLLVSTAPGLEDLHLQPGSPARDLSPINSVATDIDGEPRPYGPARDAGADEWNPGGIEVQYSAAAPVAGVIDVGGIPVGGAARLFTIHSTGPGHLKLTGNPLVAITLGANCDPLTGVQVQPPLTTIRVGNSTDFTVLIRPLGAGVFNFTLTIESNALNSPLVITVTGTGQAANGPAHAIMAAGTSFAGPMNGPFNLTLLPGAALVNATIELLDPDADLIVVQSVTALGPAPAGINPPQISVPMHPRVLTFTGTASATNPPGAYTWRVAFRDSVNASVITIDCIITIADLPPTHIIAAAFGGDGSAGNAYQAAFNRGDDAAASINLCTVSDPNAGQALTLAGATKLGGPGTVGFDFTLTAGTLRVSPAATLTFAEQGLHQYEAEVSDGANTVSIFVSISVTGTTVNFTNPSQLPTATVGEAISMQLAVTGAIGPATFTITTGQLPDGLNMNSTGQ
ncbi:MAG TPA: choice-of-anchor Q domain-containing protein, partial [Polyangiaceae bacterium]|nr:choice-of-anchor Q domain-containing protein [Polyangiaceae bacterium]